MAIDGVSRELVEKAHCGVYIEPENIEEYDTKIRVYLNDRERLQKEGDNGYVYAKNNFDRKVLAEKYIKSIQTIL
jgi:glycosyltransferase involved in cell wall biosynthesis